MLDASIALAWHFDDESDVLAEQAAARTEDSLVLVPAHWFAEVANALLAGERRRRTSPDRVASFLRRLAFLDPEVDHLDGAEIFGRLLPLARAHRLTIYDTAYLELAERRGATLATLDQALAAAARTAGVAVLEAVT